jgi:hypothetical protein
MGVYIRKCGHSYSVIVERITNIVNYWYMLMIIFVFCGWLFFSSHYNCIVLRFSWWIGVYIHAFLKSEYTRWQRVLWSTKGSVGCFYFLLQLASYVRLIACRVFVCFLFHSNYWVLASDMLNWFLTCNFNAFHTLELLHAFYSTCIFTYVFVYKWGCCRWFWVAIQCLRHCYAVWIVQQSLLNNLWQ